jgi:hypothetical protein
VIRYFVACCLLSLTCASRGQDLDMIRGKGQMIYSMSGYATTQTSVRRNLDLLWAWQQMNPGDTSTPEVPVPGGTPSQNEPHLKPRPYTREQIAQYVKDTDATWTAVLAADGERLVNGFNADLVNIFKAADLRVFAWVTIYGGADKTAYDAERDRALEILAMGVDGIIIIPSSDDNAVRRRKPSYWTHINNMGDANQARAWYMQPVVQAYHAANKLVAYSANTDLELSPDDATAPPGSLSKEARAQAMVNRRFGDMADVITPRLFWKGGRVQSNYAQFILKVAAKWDRASVTTTNTLRLKPVVPMLQAEIPSGVAFAKRSRIQEMAADAQAYLSPIGLTVFIMDDFVVPEDHQEFNGLSPNWPN